MIKNFTISSYRITIFDFVVLTIINISLVSITLLLFNKFSPIISLLTGILLTTLSIIFFKIQITFKDARFHYLLFLIIAFSSVFKINPNLYVSGGQDQGVYVNMASQLTYEGSVFTKDKTSQTLSDYPLALKYYDTYSHSNQNKEHLPGVYFIDPSSKTKYVFQFYPLHPIWISIFSIFNNHFGVYSLTAFSILSIISIYLLTFELTKDKLSSLIAACFLAFNPLHHYISKLPVSEIVTLSFFLLSLYYFLTLFKKNHHKNNILIQTILILGNVTCLFFTHINGFTYLPFFYLTLLLCVYSSHPNRKIIIRICLATFFIYFLSFLYGLFYSYPYSRDIYNITFKTIFGTSSKLVLTIPLLLMAAPLIAHSFLSQLKRNNIKQGINWLLSSQFLFLNLLLLVALYKVYQLSYTNHYANTSAQLIWNIVNRGWESIKYTNLFSTALYLSPLLIFFSYLGTINISKQLLKHKLIVILLLLYISQLFILKFTLPYQYYFTRYLLPELFPLIIIVATLFINRFIKQKNLLSFFLPLLIIIYFIFLSTFQLGKQEKLQASESYDQIVSNIQKDDYVFLAKNRLLPFGEPETSLTYFYGIYPINYSKTSDITKYFRDFIKTNPHNFYLMSEKPLTESFLILEKTVTYQETSFERSNFLPKKTNTFKEPIYVYSIDKQKIKDNAESGTISISPCEPTFTTQSFHEDCIWTKGEGILDQLNLKFKSPPQYIIVTTYGNNPYLSNFKILNPSLSLDDTDLKFSHQKDNSLYFNFPANKDRIDKITIKSSTFKPSDINKSSDLRELGLDIDTISFK